ncbi:MAG TPA: hypothetical protein VE619_10860, partial [Nitrososphaeraceae archaeon]|nr:hypothetical protein [Nitrososphaeraceae archaeon]
LAMYGSVRYKEIDLPKEIAKRGHEETIVEIQTVRKIFIAVLPVGITFMILAISTYFSFTYSILDIRVAYFYYVLALSIAGVGEGAFAYVFALFVNEESGFYLSKACFTIA